MSFPPVDAKAGPQPASVEFDVRQFGALGDGKTLDTVAINRAILAALVAGGGTVAFPAGDFLSHSIRLCSHLTLQLAPGARLIAADPPPLGQPGGYDAPEEGPPNLHQDYGHSRFRNSLIWGEHLENVTICGPGIIYGRGLSRGNGRIAQPVGIVGPQPSGHLPDVLEADGIIEPLTDPSIVPGEFGYPHPLDVLAAGVGNKAIALRECRNVTVRDLTILHGGHFAILAAACEHVTVENVFIDTNRDGIDIDACSHARVANCTVNSPWDDGICIKASCGWGGVRPVEDVTVTNCYVSGFEEGTLYDGTRSRVIRHRGGPIGRIKLGTEGSGGFRHISISHCTFEFCRGLAIEQVDGAPLEDVVVSHLTMREVMNAPIFIRLGGRLRAPGVTVPSTVRRIAISDVVATDVASDHGLFITGLPGHLVEDVSLARIELHSRGGGTAEEARRSLPEMPRDYPEPMLFGRLPSWGVFVRHAARISFDEISLHLRSADARPAVHLEDVAAVDISGLRVLPAGHSAAWILKEVTGLHVRDSDGQGDVNR